LEAVVIDYTLPKNAVACRSAELVNSELNRHPASSVIQKSNIHTTEIT